MPFLAFFTGCIADHLRSLLRLTFYVGEGALTGLRYFCGLLSSVFYTRISDPRVRMVAVFLSNTTLVKSHQLSGHVRFTLLILGAFFRRIQFC